MLRWLTAGESHGRALVAVCEGLPAGVQVTTRDIVVALARRRAGYGRGARMKFEQDAAEITGGVRHGVTLGGPVAVRVANTEWPKWETVMSPDPVAAAELAGQARNAPLTRPRPGHADLPGMQKYGYDEARPVLERASARETAARVALGELARRFLRQALGAEIVSHVVSIGSVSVPEGVLPGPGQLREVDEDPVRCLDQAASEAMREEIDSARRDGDTLGGVIEVAVYGLPPGLGSHVHWDRKLDGRLSGALMSIHAIKGVEIGDGFASARRRGSAAHDEVYPAQDGVRRGGIRRRTNRAGGIEGGISTGEVIRARAAMKPISTVPRALSTVDVRTGEPAKAINQRSDVTAVPAAGVVAESMVALVLADAALEKFGGDSVAETQRNVRGYLESLAISLSVTKPLQIVHARHLNRVTPFPDESGPRVGGACAEYRGVRLNADGSRPARQNRCLVMTVAAGAGAGALVLAACSGGAAGGAAGGSAKAAGQVSRPVRLAITPAAGARNVAPGAGVTVTAEGGTVRDVTVRSSGGTISGSLTAHGTVWHSVLPLSPSRRYTVTATAAGPGGKTASATSTFRTLRPRHTFKAKILEAAGQRYGVGMPIVVTFNRPVTRRRAVEKAITLRTSKPVVGAWFWDGANSLYFRPRTYWPQHTRVSFDGQFSGVQAAKGVYGTHDLTQTFEIGPSLIVVASTRTHYMRVFYKKKLLGRWAISTGRPGDDTADGTYATVYKANPQLMTGPGYSLEVPWSVDVTASGTFIHDAYWSVAEQGHINVSHGCINTSPAHAERYYKLSMPGDPVTVTGSPRPGVWDNGYTQWFLSWKQLLKGSALHEAVLAGPYGSRFVSPSAVPAAHARAPLGTAGSHNANAA